VQGIARGCGPGLAFAAWILGQPEDAGGFKGPQRLAYWPATAVLESLLQRARETAALLAKRLRCKVGP
jgi:hypothetical protein